MSVKLLFVLSARYPTEKAYGVTIGRTCQALSQLGIDAGIIAPNLSNEGIDVFGNRITNILENRAIFKFMYKKSIPNPRNYVLWQLVLGSYISLKFRKAKYNFCFRDVYIALIPSLILRKSNHIIEIHHSLNSTKASLVKLLIRLVNVRLAYISQNLLESNPPIRDMEKVKVIEMGVPEEFFKKDRLSIEEEISICFLGKGKSNGNSNGIERFVEQIAQVNLKRKISLTFIGLNDKELEILIQNNLRNASNIQLSFVEHLAHNQVPESLSRYQIGLIPYPDTDYHRDRFPIKILEYAALGLNILISDSKIHRSIIPQECAFFYNPKENKSLEMAIEEIIDRQTASVKRDCAYKWASSFTYVNRAKKYLQLLES
jgi:glycosyltransferase involved in cell wall biosynthesis